MAEGAFEQLKLNKQLLQAIAEAGYSQPTAIQQKAIPRILGGHDVVGIAQTGTGKTAAYVLPLLMKLRYPQGDQPRALVLAPTKELVLQIDAVIRQLAAYTGLRSVAIYGGVGPKSQLTALQAGLDILVATPGRFRELYGKGHIPVKQIKALVLDEADRMMDMGFMPQLRQIFEVIPVKRQNLLFSATMPPKVENLMVEFLDFPDIIEVTPQATPAATVSQWVYEVPNFKTKINLVGRLLADESFARVIIFTKTRQAANDLYKYLQRKGLGPANVLHANKAQNSRLAAIRAFREGELRVLVATDVAARGLDISQVSHVINFDVPVQYEDYVHRIGRTGRAQQQGAAITLVNPAEVYHLQKIEQLIKQKIERLPLPDGVEVAETPFEEQQQMARAIDHQKKLANPDYQGAFHEKKKKKPAHKPGKFSIRRKRKRK